MGGAGNFYRRNMKGYIWGGAEAPFRWLRLRISMLLHRVCLKYVEIPITTNCTLKCRECCNLIQYYQKSYMVDADRLIEDVQKLTEAVDGILMCRILGGEPLLHRDLDKILNKLAANIKIKNIQIVTNGTLLLSDNVIGVIRKNPKISVDISNYEEKSTKKGELIAQLEKNHISYHTQEDRIFWTASADFGMRNRTVEELKEVYAQCSMDCINMLNGKLHLCPRSAHGMDLKIIEENPKDYVSLRGRDTTDAIRKRLYALLNTKFIAACNYCDIYRWKDLPTVRAAEQISREEAKEILDKAIKESFFEKGEK